MGALLSSNCYSLGLSDTRLELTEEYFFAAGFFGLPALTDWALIGKAGSGFLWRPARIPAAGFWGLPSGKRPDAIAWWFSAERL
jgi:hypothetical protein